MLTQELNNKEIMFMRLERKEQECDELKKKIDAYSKKPIPVSSKQDKSILDLFSSSNSNTSYTPGPNDQGGSNYYNINTPHGDTIQKLNTPMTSDSTHPLDNNKESSNATPTTSKSSTALVFTYNLYNITYFRRGLKK